MSTLLLTPDAPPLREEPAGTIRIGGLRITLDVSIAQYRLGTSVAELIEDFDSLSCDVPLNRDKNHFPAGRNFSNEPTVVGKGVDAHLPAR